MWSVYRCADVAADLNSLFTSTSITSRALCRIISNRMDLSAPHLTVISSKMSHLADNTLWTGRASAEGTFAVGDPMQDAPPANVIVNGLGPLQLPLCDAQAEALKQQCALAPLGQLNQTAMHTSTRHVWQLSPDRIRVTNASFEQYLNTTVVGRICSAFNLHPQTPLRLSLHKLLLYETGSLLLPHPNIEKEPGILATLVVQLPSRFTGGKLIVRHDRQATEFDFSCPASSPSASANEDGGAANERKALQNDDHAEPCAACVAFYADCSHEIKPIESGHLLCLVYNIRDEIGLHIPPNAVNSADALYLDEGLSDAIKQWSDPVKTPGSELGSPLLFVLQHKCAKSALTLSSLKDQDRAHVNALLNLTRHCNLEALLVQVTKCETGTFYRDYPSDLAAFDNIAMEYVDNTVYTASSIIPLTLTDVSPQASPGFSAAEWVPLIQDDLKQLQLRLSHCLVVPDNAFGQFFKQTLEPEEFWGTDATRWYSGVGVVLFPRTRAVEVLANDLRPLLPAAFDMLFHQWQATSIDPASDGTMSAEVKVQCFCISILLASNRRTDGTDSGFFTAACVRPKNQPPGFQHGSTGNTAPAAVAAAVAESAGGEPISHAVVKARLIAWTQLACAQKPTRPKSQALLDDTIIDKGLRAAFLLEDSELASQLISPQLKCLLKSDILPSAARITSITRAALWCPLNLVGLKLTACIDGALKIDSMHLAIELLALIAGAVQIIQPTVCSAAVSKRRGLTPSDPVASATQAAPDAGAVSADAYLGSLEHILQRIGTSSALERLQELVKALQDTFMNSLNALPDKPAPKPQSKERVAWYFRTDPADSAPKPAMLQRLIEVLNLPLLARPEAVDQLWKHVIERPIRYLLRDFGRLASLLRLFVSTCNDPAALLPTIRCLLENVHGWKEAIDHLSDQPLASRSPGSTGRYHKDSAWSIVLMVHRHGWAQIRPLLEQWGISMLADPIKMMTSSGTAMLLRDMLSIIGSGSSPDVMHLKAFIRDFMLKALLKLGAVTQAQYDEAGEPQPSSSAGPHVAQPHGGARSVRPARQTYYNGYYREFQHGAALALCIPAMVQALHLLFEQNVGAGQAAAAVLTALQASHPHRVDTLTGVLTASFQPVDLYLAIIACFKSADPHVQSAMLSVSTMVTPTQWNLVQHINHGLLNESVSRQAPLSNRSMASIVQLIHVFGPQCIQSWLEGFFVRHIHTSSLLAVAVMLRGLIQAGTAGPCYIQPKSSFFAYPDDTWKRHPADIEDTRRYVHSLPDVPGWLQEQERLLAALPTGMRWLVCHLTDVFISSARAFTEAARAALDQRRKERRAVSEQRDRNARLERRRYRHRNIRRHWFLERFEDRREFEDSGSYDEWSDTEIFADSAECLWRRRWDSSDEERGTLLGMMHRGDSSDYGLPSSDKRKGSDTFNRSQAVMLAGLLISLERSDLLKTYCDLVGQEALFFPPHTALYALTGYLMNLPPSAAVDAARFPVYRAVMRHIHAKTFLPRRRTQDEIVFWPEQSVPCTCARCQGISRFLADKQAARSENFKVSYRQLAHVRDIVELFYDPPLVMAITRRTSYAYFALFKSEPVYLKSLLQLFERKTRQLAPNFPLPAPLKPDRSFRRLSQRTKDRMERAPDALVNTHMAYEFVPAIRLALYGANAVDDVSDRESEEEAGVDQSDVSEQKAVASTDQKNGDSADNADEQGPDDDDDDDDDDGDDDEDDGDGGDDVGLAQALPIPKALSDVSSLGPLPVNTSLSLGSELLPDAAKRQRISLEASFPSRVPESALSSADAMDYLPAAPGIDDLSASSRGIDNSIVSAARMDSSYASSRSALQLNTPPHLEVRGAKRKL